MEKKLLIANWKENPKTESQALKLFKAVARAKRKNTEVVICPPVVYLEKIVGAFRKTKARSGLAIGVQDIFWEEKGPYTSEIGPEMIKAIGARYVIIGHSERRTWMHETDAMINKKIKIALKDGLNVVLCVGEALAIRKQGIAAAKKFIKAQLKKDLKGIKKGRSGMGAVTIAYEPIWAIGTGKNDNPEDANEMAGFIKKIAKTKILYGGSVHSKNIADYVQCKDIDGALVGGASLNEGEFKKMISLT